VVLWFLANGRRGRGRSVSQGTRNAVKGGIKPAEDMADVLKVQQTAYLPQIDLYIDLHLLRYLAEFKSSQ
jgi:hypothetical protein